jgi:peptidoglycan/LPS O-acetylase OafA/YrhL
MPHQSSDNRLAWLDALRGIAALCVVYDHGSTLVLTSAQRFVTPWFDPGQYGVFVFFLVSGYIIPASLERKGSVRSFWIGRSFRLYPLYLVALVASAAAYALGYGTIRGAEHFPGRAASAWLLMMPNLMGGPNVPNVTWTLSYEMVFYLLLAALFSVGAHRRTGSYALACGLVVLTVGGLLPMDALEGGHGLLGPGHVNVAADAAILAGIAAAVSGRRVLAVGGACLAATIGLLLLTVNQDNYPNPWSGYAILAFMFTGTLIYRAEQGQVRKPVAAVIAVAVLAMTIGGGLWHGAQHPSWGTDSGQWRWQWVSSLLGAAMSFGIGLLLRKRRVPRALAWLGMISFSVYLLHPLILNAFRAVPVLHHASRGLDVQVPLAASLLVVIIGASAATYYLVERPMQGLGRRVMRRWDHPVGSEEGSAGDAGAGTVVAAARSASMSKAVAGGSGGSP